MDCKELAWTISTKQSKKIRIPVTLEAEDNQLLISLRAALEFKYQKRYSIAKIVRLALNELAKTHCV